MNARAWLTLDGTPVTERRFYWVWFAAATGYGVGDVVTTVAIVAFASGVVEGNPVMASAVETFGLAGLVGLKLAVFGLCLAISQYAARLGEPLFPYVLPGLLSLVGVGLTGYNIWLLSLFG
ncbi:hypothetical protein AUR64_18560 [Haloprofundus marisrubri]|uniref:DUF5658 domain-containing protein n=1 Tax=Haloprofundus marisrubri TaxID=1514971 RepID=A0A0W1R6D0_9EURY|nr:DUF5658 family protein [Haloprofundus marisrubri]KTG08669.1 hypothetical protein AUR64_18560 [Haloprofundus marisrubri]